MSSRGPRTIAEVLQSGDISALKATAAARRSLLVQVKAELEPTEADHVVSAHIDLAGSLVVSMDSAAWAARLRYQRNEVLGRNLKVRVSVRDEAGENSERKV